MAPGQKCLWHEYFFQKHDKREKHRVYKKTDDVRCWETTSRLGVSLDGWSSGQENAGGRSNIFIPIPVRKPLFSMKGTYFQIKN